MITFAVVLAYEHEAIPVPQAVHYDVDPVATGG